MMFLLINLSDKFIQFIHNFLLYVPVPERKIFFHLLFI